MPPAATSGFVSGGRHAVMIEASTWKRRLLQVADRYRRSFSYLGLSLAALFFAASTTPSLLPRHFVVQGILSGFALALGYALGVSLRFGYDVLQFRRPSVNLQWWLKRGVGLIAAFTIIACWWQMAEWQNSIRVRMQMPPLHSAYPYRMAAIALLTAAALITTWRWILWCVRYLNGYLNHWMPPRVSWTLSAIVVGFLVTLITNDLIVAKLIDAADQFFLNVDRVAIQVESSPTSGGDVESLVDWESIGRQGRLFLSTGPTSDSIQATSPVSNVLQPLRVYVGLRSRPTVEERADLALAELIRVGGFERSNLIVATPTGTGWLDPSAVDTVEHLHHGDTAIVSMQYSYLPSWITILIDPARSTRSAKALFHAIYQHWRNLPKPTRPRLVLQGLSLGSMGSELSADIYTIFEDPIDGAVWSGPPFPSPNWRQVVRNRNPDSPEWLPEYRDSRLLRFANQNQLVPADADWGPMRNVYIQHASDPMVWFSPSMAWKRPDWMKEPRGPDVSPKLRWFPLVTFLQVGFDLPLATSVPLGYGHNYSPSDYIRAWKAVTTPTGWDVKSMQQLEQYFRDRPSPDIL
ncbi:MAG: alpha/beta-hydrolase family protein [Planctomycetota bacterium]